MASISSSTWSLGSQSARLMVFPSFLGAKFCQSGDNIDTGGYQLLIRGSRLERSEIWSPGLGSLRPDRAGSGAAYKGRDGPILLLLHRDARSVVRRRQLPLHGIAPNPSSAAGSDGSRCEVDH